MTAALDIDASPVKKKKTKGKTKKAKQEKMGANGKPAPPRDQPPKRSKSDLQILNSP